MAEATSFLSTKRYAVVTGANRGIGFEICKQLASNGVMVILTARDQNKGIEAAQNLKDAGVSDSVVFHQLDVSDPKRIASLAEFVKIQFGKLDILVNNAGIIGAIVDWGALQTALASGLTFMEINWKEISNQPLNLAEECLETNYHGVTRTTEALLPLLQLSDSPRIVNVSGSLGKLKNIPNEGVRAVLDDIENLTEEKVDKVLIEFLTDFKDNSFESKGWPQFLTAGIVSKAALNAYTRMLAKKYPSITINCICPGFVKTDINGNTGTLSVEEGAASPVRLALNPHGSPSGLFFARNEVSSFD